MGARGIHIGQDDDGVARVADGELPIAAGTATGMTHTTNSSLDTLFEFVRILHRIATSEFAGSKHPRVRLILSGVMGLFALPIPPLLPSVLALLAGVLILSGR